MRRVAERVGIRAPSIYKHLPDKQALEAALISRRLRGVGGGVRAAGDARGSSAARTARTPSPTRTSTG